MAVPEPIQTTQLGLLAGRALPPFGDPSWFGGLPTFAGVPAPTTRGRAAPSRTEAPQRGQGLFAGLFNQPSGYTPQDVQKVIQDQASYYQNFPITPQWNGGRGAGGILPGIANFGSGFMGSYMQGQRADAARENERIRRGASESASGATTLEDAVRALQGGSPDQSAAALQLHLQQLAKDKERQRLTAASQQVYGAPGGSTAPAQAAPTQGPQLPAAPAQTAPPPAGNEGLLPFPLPPLNIQPEDGAAPRQDMPPTLMEEGRDLPVQPPQPSGGAPGPFSATPPAAPGAVPNPATPAPQAPAAQPTQTEPIVQIGEYRFPLSEAIRRAARGRAEGVNVKPLEDAIEVAQTELKKAAELRGTAQAGLPGAMQAANSLVRNIDWLLDNPNEVGRVTGQIQGSPSYDDPPFYSPLAYLPEYSTLFGGTSRAGITERIRQVTGQGFVQAFNAIKGAGPISDQEGAAASAAITRLANRGQGDAEYMQAVRDARREIWELVNVARAKAGQPPIPYQPHASEVRQQQGGGSRQSGAAAPGNYMWTPDGGLQRQ